MHPLPKNGVSADSQTAGVTDQKNTPEEKAEAEAEKAELSHTYTTRFGEINAVTSPAFSFDYPDGWDIVKEDVTQTSEWVTLSNERGVSIDFINLHQNNIGGGSAVLYSELEVSKVADSEFVPCHVQAEDYSDLGKFMVAELKEIGTMDTTSDSDFIPVENGAVSYAVLPESSAGEQIVNRPFYQALELNDIYASLQKENICIKILKCILYPAILWNRWLHTISKMKALGRM